ncbi:hypothetical protein TNCT_81501 [Trichonephila clavata]|uniref:Uncharacterized protein n=1 Tax=Trichonephila clavata TaxID=2740835 RepID=A0A8X6F2Y3_TRICU|nr:hypothetical protein TNCT_81501 [Trichonephila clavata]
MGSEQSPSLLEVKLQLNNISTLREKIESLRKDYYSLPAEVDLSETDNELEQLEDRLDKTELPEILETAFYVDDLVSDVSNIESGKEVQKQLNELLSCAGMNLHKGSSNCKDMLQELPYEAQEYHFDRDEEKVKLSD